jgi:hypothetical protein
MGYYDDNLQTLFLDTVRSVEAVRHNDGSHLYAAVKVAFEDLLDAVGLERVSEWLQGQDYYLICDDGTPGPN